MRISDLADDVDLNIRLRVAGGEGRLARPITWCAPTEHMDPTPFLSVNALVLTNGMGLNVKDFRIWDAYVERLVSVPVSGLAFGLGAAHRELPAGLLQCLRGARPAAAGAPAGGALRAGHAARGAGHRRRAL